MNIEDVVLVSTVREHIRGPTLEVDAAEIPRRVEAEQLIALSRKVPHHLRFPPHFPRSEASSSMDSKRVTKEDDVHESDGVGSSVSPFRKACGGDELTNIYRNGERQRELVV